MSDDNNSDKLKSVLGSLDEEGSEIPDLSSVVLTVSGFENTTSNTVMKEVTQVLVIGFLLKGVMLDLPAKCCAVGHHIQIKLSVFDQDTLRYVLEITGKVDEVDKSSGSRDQVVLTFLQYPEKLWSQVMSDLKKRQEELMKLMEATKGLG